MRIKILFGRSYRRRWHVDLCERLAGLTGAEVVGEPAGGVERDGGGLDALLTLESSLAGLKRRLTARLAPADFPKTDNPAVPVDLTIDLGGYGAPTSGRLWNFAVNGRPGEEGLVTALLGREVPYATLCEGEAIVAAARLGTEYGGSLLGSLEDALARTTTVILAALTGTARSVPALPEIIPAPPAARPALIKVAGKAIARAGLRQLYRRLYRSPHWRVGWRRVGGPDLLELRHHPATGWHSLPDDGLRFYADPFPIEHDGRVFLFVEEYPHETGKGVISVLAFDADGPVGRPRRVLELPYHLSYPFVFEADGAFWMIPESCAAGTIDLFRATDFPGGWVKQATLVADIVASDATLLRHGKRWWLFATVRDGGGAYSDALHLWWAEDFRGPWQSHSANPVLIDIASARPAGRILERDGVLWRPVQDCRRGYGAALGLARILRLDEDGFEQAVDTLIEPGPLWAGRRLHTLNRAGPFEFIDGSGSAPRWRRARS